MVCNTPLKDRYSEFAAVCPGQQKLGASTLWLSLWLNRRWVQALDAGTASVLPEGLRAELEQLEDAGGVRHLQDLKEQVQASFFI